MYEAFKYCETTPWLFMAQPINAVSNLIFVAIGFYFILKYSDLEKVERFLCILAVMMGYNSFIWHAFPSKYTLYLDVVGIFIWISVFLYISLSRIYNLKNPYINGTITLGFLALSALTGTLLEPYLIMKSATFLVPAFILIVFYFKDKNIDYLLASICLTSAVIFRIYDLSSCNSWVFHGYGTHNLWHIFSGISLFFAFRGTYKDNL